MPGIGLTGLGVACGGAGEDDGLALVLVVVSAAIGVVLVVVSAAIGVVLVVGSAAIGVVLVVGSAAIGVVLVVVSAAIEEEGTDGTRLDVVITVATVGSADGALVSLVVVERGWTATKVRSIRLVVVVGKAMLVLG